jgi:hypothetical protein
MLKQYVLPEKFHCPSCGNATAYAAIIDASGQQAPIMCNECGCEYASVGTLRRAIVELRATSGRPFASTSGTSTTML